MSLLKLTNDDGTIGTPKQMLQISHTKEDALLQIMLNAAQKIVSEACQVAFVEDGESSTFTEDIDGGEMNIWPSYLPISSITSIYDTDGEDYVDTSDYTHNGVRIFDPDEAVWGSGLKRYRVIYVAGYTALTLPGEYADIMLRIFAHKYHNRDAPLTADMMNSLLILAKGNRGIG